MSKFLKKGDIINIKKGHTVYANIPEHFVYVNRKGIFNMTRTNVLIEGDFDYFAGEYLVVQTILDGGGTGHGPNDTYPNGHHVFCKRSDNNDVMIDFYQSGCFNAMITNITPIRNIFDM